MNGASLHFIDYLIIVLSLIVTFWFGVRFSKKNTSTDQYFAAGGNIPAWAVGMSIFATLISSVTFLAYPGEGYKSNWILLIQGFMVPVVLLFSIRFIVPLYRNVIGLSAYEYFEKRFGYLARVYGSLGFIFAHFSKMGSVLFLLALALSSMTGVDTLTIIWIIGIAIVFITLFGGMEAVIWLDVIQGFLLILGGIVAIVVILLKTDGGLGAIVNYAVDRDKIGFGPYDFDFVNLTFWVMVINGVFYAIQKYGADQTIVQRYLTAKSDKDAIKAAVLGIGITVPVWIAFMFIGTALFSFYGLNPVELPQGIKSDAVFPHFITTQLPPGLIGLILSALIAAAISSLDADLNCLAAVGVDDYYKRLYPKSSGMDQLRMGKILVVVAGLAAILVASFYVFAGENDGILSTVFMLYAIFSGGIAGMLLLGLFVNRANKKGLNVGLVACILFTGYALLTSTSTGNGAGRHLLLDMGSYNYTHHKYMLGVYSHLVLFFVGWIASYFFPKTEVPNNLTYYGYLEKKRKGLI
ncbi:sodium:solute symporter [Flavobacterium palustre]|uniref:Sodium:solute symporter n=1 Tax=Flavobacterium palustre TaxID=1476463 RepID=A0ABQ1HI36_9FLAO|nr:sodium:solute symporter [Flavobacterium palustre]GGA78709.1 sodium:solute symporter [Flavobacterium palustre]